MSSRRERGREGLRSFHAHPSDQEGQETHERPSSLCFINSSTETSNAVTPDKSSRQHVSRSDVDDSMLGRGGAASGSSTTSASQKEQTTRRSNVASSASRNRVEDTVRAALQSFPSRECSEFTLTAASGIEESYNSSRASQMEGAIDVGALLTGVSQPGGGVGEEKPPTAARVRFADAAEVTSLPSSSTEREMRGESGADDGVIEKLLFVLQKKEEVIHDLSKDLLESHAEAERYQVAVGQLSAALEQEREARVPFTALGVEKLRTPSERHNVSVSTPLPALESHHASPNCSNSISRVAELEKQSLEERALLQQRQIERLKARCLQVEEEGKQREEVISALQEEMNEALAKWERVAHEHRNLKGTVAEQKLHIQKLEEEKKQREAQWREERHQSAKREKQLESMLRAAEERYKAEWVALQAEINRLSDDVEDASQLRQAYQALQQKFDQQMSERKEKCSIAEQQLADLSAVREQEISLFESSRVLEMEEKSQLHALLEDAQRENHELSLSVEAHRVARESLEEEVAMLSRSLENTTDALHQLQHALRVKEEEQLAIQSTAVDRFESLLREENAKHQQALSQVEYHVQSSEEMSRIVAAAEQRWNNAEKRLVLIREERDALRLAVQEAASKTSEELLEQHQWAAKVMEKYHEEMQQLTLDLQKETAKTTELSSTIEVLTHIVEEQRRRQQQVEQDRLSVSEEVEALRRAKSSVEEEKQQLEKALDKYQDREATLMRQLNGWQVKLWSVVRGFKHSTSDKGWLKKASGGTEEDEEVSSTDSSSSHGGASGGSHKRSLSLQLHAVDAPLPLMVRAVGKGSLTTLVHRIEALLQHMQQQSTPLQRMLRFLQAQLDDQKQRFNALRRQHRQLCLERQEEQKRHQQALDALHAKLERRQKNLIDVEDVLPPWLQLVETLPRQVAKWMQSFGIQLIQNVGPSHAVAHDAVYSSLMTNEPPAPAAASAAGLEWAASSFVEKECDNVVKDLLGLEGGWTALTLAASISPLPLNTFPAQRAVAAPIPQREAQQVSGGGKDALLFLERLVKAARLFTWSAAQREEWMLFFQSALARLHSRQEDGSRVDQALMPSFLSPLLDEPPSVSSPTQPKKSSSKAASSRSIASSKKSPGAMLSMSFARKDRLADSDFAVLVLRCMQHITQHAIDAATTAAPLGSAD